MPKELGPLASGTKVPTTAEAPKRRGRPPGSASKAAVASSAIGVQRGRPATVRGKAIIVTPTMAQGLAEILASYLKS